MCTNLLKLLDGDLSRVLSDVSVEHLCLKGSKTVGGDQVVAFRLCVGEDNGLAPRTCRSRHGTEMSQMKGEGRRQVSIDLLAGLTDIELNSW